MLRRTWVKLIGVLAGIALIMAGGLWLLARAPGDGRIVLPAKESYISGPYLAYAQPWGAESHPLVRFWARFGDKISIAPDGFPSGSTMQWTWPPFLPGNGVGVWSFNQISFGNYDGGETEEPVTPLRVRDIKALNQTFAWRLENRWGDANVLSEFYLRSDPEDSESKLLEIGWFLHAPRHTRKFVESARDLGTFTDSSKRVWRVAIEEKFCMFVLRNDGDLAKGKLDMLEALRWLRQKGLVKGDEWVTGVAIGAETQSGHGRLHLDKWGVELR